MQTKTIVKQEVTRLVALNSAFLKRVETMDQYEAEAARGIPVILSNAAGTCEISPVAYEYADQPINHEIDTAGEWFLEYQRAVRARRKATAAEWLDDLEVLVMHTPYDTVKTLVASWLETVDVPRRWRAN